MIKTIKRVFVVLLGIISAFVIPLCIFSFFTYSKLATPGFYTDYLKNSRFLELYLRYNGDFVVKGLGNDFDSIAPRLNETFNRNIVERQFYFILKETIDYFKGKNVSPDFRIELAKTKLEIKEMLQPRSIMSITLGAAVNLLPDVFDMGEKYKQWNTKAEAIKPLTMKIHKYNFILILIPIILIALIFLLTRDRHKQAKYFAILFTISGVFFSLLFLPFKLLFGLFLRFVFIAANISAGYDRFVSKIPVDLVDYTRDFLNSNFIGMYLIISLIILGLGIIIFFLRPAKSEPAKPDTVKTETGIKQEEQQPKIEISEIAEQKGGS